jgi:hypothetical protein
VPSVSLNGMGMDNFIFTLFYHSTGVPKVCFHAIKFKNLL